MSHLTNKIAAKLGHLWSKSGLVNESGFSLMELMVSAGLFAIVAGASVTTMQSFSNANRDLENAANRNSTLSKLSSEFSNVEVLQATITKLSSTYGPTNMGVVCFLGNPASHLVRNCLHNQKIPTDIWSPSEGKLKRIAGQSATVSPVRLTSDGKDCSDQIKATQACPFVVVSWAYPACVGAVATCNQAATFKFNYELFIDPSLKDSSFLNGKTPRFSTEPELKSVSTAWNGYPVVARVPITVRNPLYRDVHLAATPLPTAPPAATPNAAATPYAAADSVSLCSNTAGTTNCQKMPICSANQALVSRGGNFVCEPRALAGSCPPGSYATGAYSNGALRCENEHAIACYWSNFSTQPQCAPGYRSTGIQCNGNITVDFVGFSERGCFGEGMRAKCCSG